MTMQIHTHLQEGNSFCTTFSYYHCVLIVASQCQGQDDKEFDTSDEQELGYLILSINGKQSIPYGRSAYLIVVLFLSVSTATSHILNGRHL